MPFFQTNHGALRRREGAGKEAIRVMTTFSSLGIAEPILTALTDYGYEIPTVIQEKAIPAGLAGRVLESAMLTPREACQTLARLTRSEPVQVIGTKFVLYRESHSKEKKDKIVLVKDRKKPNPN